MATVAGFRVDPVDETLQVHPLGTLCHRNRHCWNEWKRARVTCDRSPRDGADAHRAELFRRYTQFRQLGLPNAAIRQIMGADGLGLAQRAQFFGNEANAAEKQAAAEAEAAVASVAAATAREADTATLLGSTDAGVREHTSSTATVPQQQQQQQQDKEEKEEPGKIEEKTENMKDPNSPVYVPDGEVRIVHFVGGAAAGEWTSVTEWLAQCQWSLETLPTVPGGLVCNNCNYGEEENGTPRMPRVPASVRCETCEEFFCDDCFKAVHSGGKRKAHIPVPLSTKAGVDSISLRGVAVQKQQQQQRREQEEKEEETSKTCADSEEEATSGEVVEAAGAKAGTASSPRAPSSPPSKPLEQEHGRTDVLVPSII